MCSKTMRRMLEIWAQARDISAACWECTWASMCTSKSSRRSRMRPRLSGTTD